ncbi:hypothetical protein [Ottowia thiooxydans]|uniref:Uncharacterized protein n=1 Tax=Ottowia thiooxydans TaxID=219182 RepID=A0ABV2QE67_9BURK
MSSQLIDHTPPNGDFARYIDKLMREAEIAQQSTVAVPAKTAGSASPRTAVPAQPRPPGATSAVATRSEGPPELVDLVNKVFKRSSLPKEGKSAGAWWPWVAMALVVFGVIFPVAIGTVAVIAFVVWRALKKLSGTRGARVGRKF